MSMRKQIYQWTLNGNGAYNSDDYPNAGEEISIFAGDYGNVVTEANLIREDRFVVIHQFGSTPGIAVPSIGGSFVASGIVDGTDLIGWIPNGFVNVFINTTGYFQDPQNLFSGGISGEASPYPATAAIRPTNYQLSPPVYALPDQTWDIRITFLNDIHAFVASEGITDIPTSTVLARVFVQYWLFDGSDALIANNLLDLGIDVTVDNIEWFRRQLLQREGLDEETWKDYLDLAEAYRHMEDVRDEYLL